MNTRSSEPYPLETIEYGYLNRIRLVREPSPFISESCKSADAAYELLKQLMGDSIDIYESFFALFLNRANIFTDYAKISQGGISGTLVDSRLILKYAIETLSSGVILAHNHPSGNFLPSKTDKDLTLRIQKQLAQFEIQVLDHLIITTNRYYSFAEQGDLSNP